MAKYQQELMMAAEERGNISKGLLSCFLWGFVFYFIVFNYTSLSFRA